MRNVAVLSHNADIDGVGATALVRMKYGIPLGNIFFTGHSIAETRAAESDLKRLYKQKTLLFITDMTPTNETVRVYENIIKKIHAGGGKVIFLDHHLWRQEFVERIAKNCDLAVFGENKEKCATELVAEFLNLKNAFAKEFAHLTHHADFYIQLQEKRQGKLLGQYVMYIDGVNMSRSYRERVKKLRRMAALISSGHLIDNEIKKGAREFEIRNEERIERMLRELYHISDNIAIGFTRQVDSTEACERVMRKANVGIGIVINLDQSKGSIRSEKDNIVDLAGVFGGGGHPHAAGFTINPRTHDFRKEKNRKTFVKKIEIAAKEVGLV